MSKRRAEGAAVTRKPKRPAAKKPMKRRLLTVLKWGLIVGLVIMLTGMGAFYYAYTQTTIPNPNAEFQTETTVIYYADGKTQLGTFATQNRESIPYSEMPDNIKQAVVAAEDQSFWTNQGIDPKGIIRAAFSNARGNSTQGASTITQQYVKILYLTQERSFNRKLKEAFLSLKLQREQSKQEILEGYLNTIYFGRGAYGIQAAAMAYFDVPAKDLNLKQAAVLASVLNDPNDLDPAEGKEARAALKERYTYVLGSMADTGDITAEEADQASQTLPKFPKIEADSQYGGQKGHMLRLVRQELRQMGYSEEEIDGGGLRVTTTFTPEAMQAAEEGVLAQKPEGFGDKELHIAAATVEPGTGALLGFYGGQDYLDSEINWAEAGGMVGSTFKPFTLATAITEGFSLEDTFEGNSPYEFPDGLEVRNEGGGDGNDYGSEVDATYALEESINTAFVDMSASIPDGPEKIDGHGQRARHPAGEARQEVPRYPEGEPRPQLRRRADHPRPRPDQPDQHGQRLRHHRQRRRARQRPRDQEGRGPQRRGREGLRRRQHRRARPRHRLRRLLRHAAGRPAGHRPGRPGAGPPGRRQDRHRHQRQGPGFLGVVRRLHPPDLDGGDVRPRRRRRPARRVAAVLLRCRLPGPHLDGDHAAGHGGHGRRGVPAARQRRRRGTDRGPRPRAHHGAAADEAADQEAQSDGLSDRRADRRATDEPTDEPTKDPTGVPTTEPTPTVTPTPTPTLEPTPSETVVPTITVNPTPSQQAPSQSPIQTPTEAASSGATPPGRQPADPDPRVKPRSPAEPPTVMG